MRFEYEGKTYTIEFQRSHRLVQIGYDEKTGQDLFANSLYPYTTVNLYRHEKLELDGITVIKLEPFRTYTVGCAQFDNYSAEEGRKGALRMLCYGNSLDLPGTSKAERKGLKTAIWKTYLNRPRQVSKPKPEPIEI